MRAVFVVGHAAVADFEHIRVVPRARPGGRRVLRRNVEVRQHAVPAVLDVVGGAPQVPRRGSPAPRLVRAPFADAEHDRAAGLREGVAELGVLRRRVEPFGVAPVFLHVIDAPLGERPRVLLLVAVCAGPALAGLTPRVGVDAELQSLGVHVVGERFDAAGKARGVRDEPSLGVARHLPAIVDHDVLVAGVAHAVGGHGVGRFLDELRAHVAAEVIPAVPTHRRRAGEPVVDQPQSASSGQHEWQEHDPTHRAK